MARRRNVSMKLGVAILVLILAVSYSVPVLAATNVIQKAKYEGNGKVDIDFNCKVQYKNAKVTVKDSSGKAYGAYILDKDNDDLEFKVSNIKAGKTYTFTVSGVRRKGATTYTKFSGKFTVPSSVVSTTKIIKRVTYEGNGKVDVDFNFKMQYKNAKVTVKDSSGKAYSAYIIDKDSDDLEFRVSNISAGKTYSFTISGIRKKGAAKYTSRSGKFTAK